MFLLSEKNIEYIVMALNEPNFFLNVKKQKPKKFYPKKNNKRILKSKRKLWFETYLV